MLPGPPTDLDCDNISSRSFKVIGSDPHDFDGDNDDMGCKSSRVVEAAVEIEVIMAENVIFRIQKTAYYLLRPPPVLPDPIRHDLPQKIKPMQ